MQIRISHFILLSVCASLIVQVFLVAPVHADDADVMDAVPLLEPISGVNGESVTIGPGINTWLCYWVGQAGMGGAGCTVQKGMMEWLFDIAIGFCVLWVLIGSIQVMISGDDNSKRTEGFEKMKASILGLVILVFAGTILRMLNSSFFI